MSAIWRPTSCHDLGIDGQIEFLEPGEFISTGHIVAVQSKSGPSYFNDQYGSIIRYYPDEKHRQYWHRLKMPVILVLHNPDSNETIYTNVKPQLTGVGPILINRSKVFDRACRESLLDTIQELGIPSPIEILDKLKKITLNRDGNRTITGIEFLLACVNRTGRYFELRMRRISALFELLSNDNGYHIGELDFEYILRNVIAMHSNRIVEDFMNEFEYFWYELYSVPDVASPLTAIGDDVIDCLWANPDNYINLENYSHLGIKGSNELIDYISRYVQACSDRLDSSDRISIEPR
jgi:hypothetical protein